MYKNKYLKYKNKYLEIKKQIGGIIESNKFIDPSDIKSDIENNDDFIYQLLKFRYRNSNFLFNGKTFIRIY